eukprot:10865574-Lingulodinium_polyedra.AAC.1
MSEAARAGAVRTTKLRRLRLNSFYNDYYYYYLYYDYYEDYYDRELQRRLARVLALSLRRVRLLRLVFCGDSGYYD